MYKLIITEKPSVAQSIAAVLGANNRMDGYLEGNGWLVSWCVGHLSELASAEVYDEKYAVWKREDLPIVPRTWLNVVPPAKKKRHLALCELMNREDVESIVNACDAGREGELIFRNLYNNAKCHKPVERLWISSMEDEAIREGFQHLRPGAEYDNLYQAALCRAQADWLIGINATRLFSVLYHRTLNVGRVISPTLAMLVQREQEMQSFRPTAFYTPHISVGGVDATGERFDDKDDADAAAASCGNTAVVRSVVHAEKSSGAPALFDLTTLQREANRRCGYTAQQTLDYLQALYEKKLVTYPRTDSRYLTDDMEGIVRDRAIVAAKVCGLSAPEDITPGVVCDSKRVSDHHAIIPTATAADADMTELPGGEATILALVSWSFLRAVAGAYRYDEVVVTLDCGGNDYVIRGKTIIDLGWMRYDKHGRDHAIPEFTEGQEIDVSGVSVREGKTSPPRAYTEDTLLAAMEAAGSYNLPDDAERRGIGTPATRAGMLEKLVASGFVTRVTEKKQARLVPSQLGISLISVLPEELRSPNLTSEWERQLKMIERGELSPFTFRDNIARMLRELVYNAKAVPGAELLFPSGRPVIGKCPRCGGDVTESKNGFFCEANECRFALWRDNRYLTAKRIELTREMAEALIEDGEVMVRGMYSEKTGTTYDALLVLDDDGQRTHYHVSFNYGE